MKPEELRIGNWVKYNGKEYQIHSLSKEIPCLDTLEFGVGVVDWRTIEPIPLDEEWLLKFEANKISAPYMGFKYSRFKLIWKEGYKYWYVVDWQDETYLTKIEFVHEWQNFVHIMNGKELTIKQR